MQNRVLSHLLPWLAASAALALSACTGDPLTLDLEIKDGAATPNGKPEELQLLVKAIPGAELTYDGQTKSTGDQANETFTIPKSKLKLGKNNLGVSAVAGSFLTKKSAVKSITYDAQPKNMVRVRPSAAGDSELSLTCDHTMCAPGAFKLAKNGHLPLDVESYIPITITIQGQKAELAPGKTTTLDLDLVPKLAVMQTGAIDRLALPVGYEGNGVLGVESIFMSGPAVLESVVQKLGEIERGPVAFPGDTPGGPDPKSMVVIGAPTSKLIVVGPSVKLQELDAIAVAKPGERFFGCSAGNSLGIVYKDLEVTAYARRTGKAIGTRKLLADRVACPPTQTANLTGNVREDDVKKVLGELLKK